MPKITKNKWVCRWSSTLGELEDSADKIWGTKPYNPKTDIDKPCVFFGVYGLPDFYALWRHKGDKAILWCGTDITHFMNGYWLDDEGDICLDPKALAKWINRNCVSFVENEVEQRALSGYGIESKVRPSFLGDVKKYQVKFKKGNNVYLSVSGNNFHQYGWNKIKDIAKKCPKINFHLYGNYQTYYPLENIKNVFVKGRVSKEKMNKEISQMQCGLRLNKDMDGFSEITAKSILWGQYPIVYRAYSYPLIDSFSTINELCELLNDLPNKTKPNIKAREYYLTNLNNYIWNSKKQSI